MQMHWWQTQRILSCRNVYSDRKKEWQLSECKRQKEEEFYEKLQKQINAGSGKAYYTVTADSKTAKNVTYLAPVKKNVTSVTIPNTVKINGIIYKVTVIAKNAFKNNKKLTKVSIGSNIVTIGDNAFYGCKKLKTVTFGKNIKTIGKQAFYGCKALKTLNIESTKLTAKKVGSKAFAKTPKNMTIKVPKKQYKTYKSMLVKKGISKKAKFKKK